MTDHLWVIINPVEARTQIRKWGAKPLVCSCSHYKYFSTHLHPLIKHDSKKGDFFGSEDYRKLMQK
jgi:hypothetical protein